MSLYLDMNGKETNPAFFKKFDSFVKSIPKYFVALSHSREIFNLIIINSGH